MNHQFDRSVFNLCLRSAAWEMGYPVWHEVVQRWVHYLDGRCVTIAYNIPAGVCVISFRYPDCEAEIAGQIFHWLGIAMQQYSYMVFSDWPFYGISTYPELPLVPAFARHYFNLPPPLLPRPPRPHAPPRPDF